MENINKIKKILRITMSRLWFLGAIMYGYNILEYGYSHLRLTAFIFSFTISVLILLAFEDI